MQKENSIEQKVEQIAEDAEDAEIDYTLMFDELLLYLEHPINLNRTNKNELIGLNLLTEIQINNLLQHIEANGKLMAIYELQAIKGFDLQTIQRILPYITVSSDIDRPRITFKEVMKNGQHQFIGRQFRVLEEQKGYTAIDDSSLAAKPNSRYLGSPDRIYARYRFNYSNKLAWGFTAEKDPGEEFFIGTQKQGFDFLTAHLFARNIGIVKAIAIGDFQAQFGQGMTFWSGLAFRKSAFALNLKRQGMGLRPSGSVDESRFLRGAGITLGVKNFEFTAFGSYKKIDVNAEFISDSLRIDDEDVIIESTLISSIVQTGFHRTPSELEKKNLVTETIYGGNFAYKKRNLSIGLTVVRTQYGGEFFRNLSFYNQFELNNNQNSNIGLDYNYIFRNMNFFGEASRSENGGMAIVNGVIMSVDPRLTLIFMHRNYGRNYQALHGIGIGEGTKVANEQGFYSGFVLNPIARVSITAYYDRFTFPWMRYQVNAPSYGTDALAQLTYSPSRKTEMYFRIRQRDKFRNSPEDIDDIVPIVPTNQVNYRYSFSYSLSPSIKLRNRVDMIDFKIGERDTEKGYMIMQDLVYKPLSKPFSLTLRYAIFDTDSWNARNYTYESNVLYAFAIPAYYGRGTRTYAMLRYNFKRNIDLWLRYGHTFYYNRDIIGTGLEEIQGNVRSEMTVQVRWKF
ncbi:MAG: helix-hairpin-helix domain-containing protein [Bacteroidetes bacterium]|nr:helix-hairpin-helix domain-containing protein [Bacteroidota bacterium]